MVAQAQLDTAPVNSVGLEEDLRTRNQRGLCPVLLKTSCPCRGDQV